MKKRSVVIEDSCGVIKGVRSVWAEKMLLDYTIEVQDQEFRVHKLIMAATSDYFRAMLTGGMAESQTDRVRLQGLSPLAVSNMIQLIYTGEFGADKADIEELLACAMYLQIPGAIDDCRRLVLEEMNPQNCFKLLSMLQTYSAEDVIKETVAYITSHFEEVYEAWEPIEMTYTDIKNFVDLWQKSEWDVFLAIKHWVEIDMENHGRYLNDLMSCVRFALMTPKQLDAILGTNLYSIFEGLWRENVDEALQYHDLPTYAKVLHDSEQSRIKDDPRPFYFNPRFHEYWGLRTDTCWTECDEDQEQSKHRMSWQKWEALKKPEIWNGIETFVVVNNFLIVCETFNRDQNWHILDPRTMKWSSMAELWIPRQDFALVFCDKHLYVLGGCPEGTFDSAVPTDIIERYALESNSWSIVPDNLPVPLFKHAAAVIGDCVYIAGGLLSNEELSTGFDCFDTSTGTWHKKASLPDADRDLRKIDVMEYCNEDVIFIMYRHLKIHYYSPVQDQWFNLECHVGLLGQSQLRWHSDASVLSNGKNTFFLLNFMTKDEHYNSRAAGQCAQWTLKGKRINEDRLPDNPVREIGYFEKCTREMLLAVQPQSSTPVCML